MVCINNNNNNNSKLILYENKNMFNYIIDNFDIKYSKITEVQIKNIKKINDKIMNRCSKITNI
jgi:hypothetical protein